jgi:hypothetical protein
MKDMFWHSVVDHKIHVVHQDLIMKMFNPMMKEIYKAIIDEIKATTTYELPTLVIIKTI